MSAKFTPGPWRVEHARVAADTLNEVCSFGHLAKTGRLTVTPEDEANAHLIAAAPDMYEALEACLADLAWIASGDGIVRTSTGAQDKARAALAKARGETP